MTYRAALIIYHVEQMKFVGEGDTVAEAASDICYCEGGKQLSIFDILENETYNGNRLEVAVYDENNKKELLCFDEITEILGVR